MAQEVFTAVIGGALIGISAAALLALTGRTAGISSIAAGAFSRDAGERQWRVAFLGGLVAGGLLLALFRPEALGTVPRPLAAIAIAGVLVGIGARLSGGCTSGHGICGIGRLAPRSLLATVVFMATGALTVFVWRVLS